MTSVQPPVIVAGVGMIPFSKPGTGRNYQEMGVLAGRQALSDAGLEYGAVEQVYAGYVYGDSTSGQAVAYGIGMSGVPVINVNNNCSSGSTALFLARQAIAGGAADCVLVLGFEQMKAGALDMLFDDRPSPMTRFDDAADGQFGMTEIPLTLRYFSGAGRDHMEKYGTKFSTFAEVRAKASRHARNNPLALFRAEVTAEQVLASPPLVPGLMTRLMACPPTCGAAAAVLVSENYARRHGLPDQVRIRAQAMTTDTPSTFETDMIRLVGADITAAAARRVYEIAGIGPGDLDVVELHDCFAQNELITYEGLGLAVLGEGERFVLDGNNTYGGRVVTNPSGGLLSKGHPLGATGLAQCYELTHQLRGTADARQVDGARLALQHNLGMGGACVVTLYEGT